MNSNPPSLAAGNPPPLPPPAQTSTLAVLSLIFGILGCTFVGAIAGLTCGIMAKVRIGNSAGRLKGDGLALAGIIVSGVMLLLTPVMAGMLLPALGKAKAKAQTIHSVNNLRRLGLAARINATDHDGKFPAATNWCDTLRPELGDTADSILRRPANDPTSECGYGYNLGVAGLADDAVNPQTVLFFELETPRCNAVGGEELLRRPREATDAVVVGFADGTVQQLWGDNLSRLRWRP